MDTKEFLSRVLSDTGNYCVFANHLANDQRKQMFYTSLDDVVDTATDLDGQGYDVYFALATFSEAGSRRVNNTLSFKAFFLDLDCGPSKDFTTKEEAIAELRRFSKELKLPKPLMVNSGRGIHVYWALEEAVPTDDWLPVANQLKAQCAQLNFLADPAVTADAARVLRVIDTHNHKTDPPSKVEIYGVEPPPLVDFDAFAELLGKNSLPVPQRNTRNPTNAVMQALMGNSENKFGAIVNKIKIGSGCKQLETIINDQDNCSEPMWRAGLSIAKFCSDSEKAAHFISRRHEGYKPEDTAYKLDLIKCPYQCIKFDEFNPKVCRKCPYWGKIKSPIVLGRHIIEASEEDNVVETVSASLPNAPTKTYVIPEYPRPYFRGANGGIYVRASGPDGEPEDKLIYHNDIYVVKRVHDPELGESVVMCLHLPKDGMREFTLPLTAVTSREEFRKNMSAQGVAIKRMDELMDYTTTWVNELQAKSVAETAHRQFGWTGDDMKSFVLGNQEIFGDRIDFNPPASNTIAMFPAFESKGTLEDWKETIAFLDQDGQEAYQYVLGASFGSILMKLMPVACSMLHLHSDDSGLGKTTAQFAGLGVWGNPEELILSKEDKYLAKMNRAEIYNNLPFFMDEVTNMKPSDLSDMAYQLYGGKQRRRLTSSASIERLNGYAWSFVTVSRGNTRLIEKIMMDKQAPKAEAQRILEYKVSKHYKSANTKETTDAFALALQNNYGHAGVPFVQYVINNLDDVKEMLKEIQLKVDSKAGLAAENRFWSAGAACTLTALYICKSMGLLPYKTKKVYKWILGVLEDNKRSVADMSSSAEQVLNDYLNDHYGNVLWIKSTDDLRKTNKNGLDELVIPDLNPRARLVARYETDVKRAYLVPKPLREWCGKHQVNYASFVQDLKSKMSAKKSKMRLSKGTHLQLPPTDVIVVDCSVQLPQGDVDAAV